MTDKNKVFEYLDDLRESGITNMFGALPLVMNAFVMEEREATKLLSEWMTTFSTRHPQ